MPIQRIYNKLLIVFTEFTVELLPPFNKTKPSILQASLLWLEQLLGMKTKRAFPNQATNPNPIGTQCTICTNYVWELHTGLFWVGICIEPLFFGYPDPIVPTILRPLSPTDLRGNQTKVSESCVHGDQFRITDLVFQLQP